MFGLPLDRSLGEGDVPLASTDELVPFCWDDRDGLEGGVKGQLSLSAPSSIDSRNIIPDSPHHRISRERELCMYSISSSHAHDASAKRARAIDRAIALLTQQA